MRGPVVLALALTGSSLVAAEAVGAEPPAATFALIVGANRSVDGDLKPLFYADDDAARYQALFGSLGARTVLLTRLDANTLRVLPTALVSAAPDRRSLEAAVEGLAAEVRDARARGLRTVLYFVFAGHGKVGDGRAHLGLEDHRLTGEDIDRLILRAVAAEESHLIVDACYSYFLAYQRGPGGRVRPVQGFSQLGGQLDRPDVGMLLSTSATRESHEWDGFQAGVFSHEVRSGLHGAADIDGDGQISYREIGAFVVRANAAIQNERLRPDVFARPPQGSARLLDLRPALDRGLVVDPGFEGGHYLIEDRAGNRLLDFHSSPGRRLRLIRPGAETVFMRQVDTGREYEIAASSASVQVRKLHGASSPVRVRGAAHLAFSLIFSLPFDEQSVRDYQFPRVELTADGDGAEASGPRWRRVAAAGSWATAGLAGLGAGVFTLASRSAAEQAARSPQIETPALNRKIEGRRRQAIWLGAVSTAAAAAGLLFSLWPATTVSPTFDTGAGTGAETGVTFGLGGRF
jgi:hypothetical protein